MFSFPKQAKIVKTDDFSSVFNLRKRIANKHLVIRYRVNEFKSARLGLIVSKKTAKLAVQRNYMRRVMRELFRLNQHRLPRLDLIIQIQKAFDRPDFTEIKNEFECLIKKIETKNLNSSIITSSKAHHESSRL
jgi:ribonuclease P protein component